MHLYILGKLAEAHRHDLLSGAERQRANRSRTKAIVRSSGISVSAAIIAMLSACAGGSRQVGSRLSFIGRVAEHETRQP